MINRLKKYFPKILLLAIIMAVVFSPIMPATKVFAAEPLPLSGPVDPEVAPGGGLPGGTVTSESPGATAVANDNAVSPPQAPKNASCVDASFPFFHLDACVASIVYMLMWIVSWFLFLAGFIFDQSMNFTLNIADLMTRIPVVDIGWKIFRDLANIFFIFILLWIAISTILGFNSGKTKELIVHLVVVAILMNFSLFITKTVIDGSNIIALHFYNLIVTPSADATGTFLIPSSSMSGAFMEGLKIQTLYDGSAVGAEGQETRKGFWSKVKDVGVATVAGAAAGSVPGAVVAGGAALLGGNVINWGKIILIGIFGSALMLIAAYVFLVGAVLMLIRAIVLMFVMMLSPLAFLALALPFAEKYAEPWREALIKQCIFAPAFMTLSYVVVRTIQSPAFKGVVSVTTGDASLASAFTAGSGGGVAMIINFLLVIGLMLGCILVAKKLEVHGFELAKAVGATGARWVASGRFISTAASVASFGFKSVGRVAGTIGSTIRGGQGGIKGIAAAWKNPEAFGKKIGLGIGKIAEGAGKIPGKIGTSLKTGYESTKQFVKEPGKYGEKLSGFGEKLSRGAEEWQKKFDVVEWDKKFGKSAFGRTELGDFIRRKTTGGDLFGAKAKFGGEKSVKESYEESEHLRQLREDTENKEHARRALESLRLVELIAKDYEKPDLEDEKYKNADGTINYAAFEADFQKHIDSLFKLKQADYVPSQYDKKYNNPDGSFNQTLFDQDNAAGKVAFNKNFLDSAGVFDRAKFDAAVLSGQAEFAAAEALLKRTIALQPHRGAFATGAAGDKDFSDEQAKFETYFEKPDPKNPLYVASAPLYNRAKKIYDDGQNRKKKNSTRVDEEKANVSSAMNALSSQGFSELDEHDIKHLAPYATVIQIDALLKSTEWTMKEKKAMLTQYDEMIGVATKFQKKIEDYDIKMDAINAEIAKGNIALGADKKITGIVERDGKRYVKPKVGPEIEVPDEPELPSKLRNWARNDVTLRGYEIMASIRPDALKIPTLVQVIRWGMTHKDLRNNNNIAFKIREDMTYLKDYKIWRLFKGNEHYLEENTETERIAAYKKATLAAEAAGKAAKAGEDAEALARRAWDQTLATELPKDTLRTAWLESWLSDRAPNEIAGARGRFRNSTTIHSGVGPSELAFWKGKDSSDTQQMEADLIAAYIMDLEGIAEMTRVNKEALNWMMTNRSGKELTRQPLHGQLVDDQGYTDGKVEIKDVAGTVLKTVSLDEVLIQLDNTVKEGDRMVFASDLRRSGKDASHVKVGTVK